MTAQGKMDKGKVYIVREGDYIDSVWDSVDDAIARRDKVREQGFLVDVVVRKVR